MDLSQHSCDQSQDHNLRRRDFIKGMSALFLSSLYHISSPGILYGLEKAVPDQRRLIERGYKLDKSKLPEIQTPFRSELILTTEERKKNLEQLIEKLKSEPSLMGKKVNVDSSSSAAHEETWVRFEPDIKYATRLVMQAKSSVSHMLDFVGGKYISPITIRFVIPQSAGEMVTKNEPLTPFYMVADIIKLVRIEYPLEVDGEKKSSTLMFKKSGESGFQERSFEVLATNEGFEIKGKINNNPIFYCTNDSYIRLIETPPIEILHRCIQKYSEPHLKNKIRKLELTGDRLMNAVNETFYEEERFVHALSILWLTKYNKDYNMGLTNKELAQRFQEYESNKPEYNRYNGANRLSEYIRKIGVGNAMELYINSPDKLFKVLKK